MCLMNHGARDLFNHFGSTLAGILEEASVTAALIPGVPDEGCQVALTDLREATANAQAIVSAMATLLRLSPIEGARTR